MKSNQVLTDEEIREGLILHVKQFQFQKKLLLTMMMSKNL